MDDSVLLLDTCICIKEKGECEFIKYDNIYTVRRPVLNSNSWIVTIIYVTPYQKDIGFDFVSSTKKAAEENYVSLVNQLIKYHTKSNVLNEKLNEKLDKLLSHIEILPGGEEYEKAKDHFLKSD